MPFTPTHILAIVPLAAVRRWRLPFSALAIGSMIPDLPLFVPLASNYGVTHSTLGLFTADLPLGLAGFLAFQLLFKGPLFALLPAAIQRRCVGLARPNIEATGGFGLRAVLAVVVGALTHIAWDSFTHRDRTGTHLVPGLNATAFALGGSSVPYYKALQYGCTAVGLPLLAVLAVRWLRRQRPGSLDGVAVLPNAAKVTAWLVAGVIPAAAVAYVASRGNLSPYRKLGWTITRSGLAELVALTGASVAFRAWAALGRPDRSGVTKDVSKAGDGAEPDQVGGTSPVPAGLTRVENRANPWEWLEPLEARADHPSFPMRWRKFMADCVAAILPDLPPEARAWAEAADAFDRGRLPDGSIVKLVGRAWIFLNDRPAGTPAAERAGLLVVIGGLATQFDPARWQEAADLFLADCQGAGMSDALLAELFERHFGDLVPPEVA